MKRLKTALTREYDADPDTNINFYDPRNTVAVELNFRGEKMAKVMGTLAMEKPETGKKVSGILVKRNFNYHILSASELPKYSDLTMSTVTQRQSVYFSGSFDFLVSQLFVYLLFCLLFLSTFFCLHFFSVSWWLKLVAKLKSLRKIVFWEHFKQ